MWQPNNETQYIFGTYNYSLDHKIDFTCTLPRYCEHSNGWFGIIDTFWSKFLGVRGIRTYCCSDCGDFIYGKELKLWEEFNKKINERKCRICGTEPKYLGNGCYTPGCMHSVKEIEDYKFLNS